MSRPERPVRRQQQRVHALSRRLGPDDVARLVDDYESGLSTNALAERYAIGKGTVLKLLQEAGIHRRSPSLSPEECARAIELYRTGLSCAAVGERIGRDHMTVYNVLKRAGIPRRDRHGWER